MQMQSKADHQIEVGIESSLLPT